MELTKLEKLVVEDALQHYWHYVVNELGKRNLGDIHRSNLEIDKKRIEELLTKFK